MSQTIKQPGTDRSYALIAGLIVLVPVFAVVAPDTEWTGLPAQAWMAVGWMAFLSSLLGYGLWFYALGTGGIARIGSLQLAMPVVTIFAAAIFLDETFTIELAFTTTAIVFGTWWAHRHT